MLFLMLFNWACGKADPQDTCLVPVPVMTEPGAGPVRTVEGPTSVRPGSVDARQTLVMPTATPAASTVRVLQNPDASEISVDALVDWLETRADANVVVTRSGFDLAHDDPDHTLPGVNAAAEPASWFCLAAEGDDEPSETCLVFPVRS